MWATSAPAEVGRRVALKFSGVGDSFFRVLATVAGKRPSAGTIGMEMEVDEEGRGLVRRLLEYIEGRAGIPLTRPPRYRLTWPAVVFLPSGAVYMNTFSVSAGGCGLSWIGPRPRVGSVQLLRLGGGPGAPHLRAMVCWLRDAPGGLRIGMRFVGGDAAGLKAILEKTASAAISP